MDIFKITKLNENAIIPSRATPASAGLDLCACIGEPLKIPARGNALVSTGIAIELPEKGMAAFVFARSGLAIKHGLGLLNGVGVVDSDYRGEIKVGLANNFDEDYTIQPGERIAQMVILPVCMLRPEEAEELEETLRGSGGFGSTGK